MHPAHHGFICTWQCITAHFSSKRSCPLCDSSLPPFASHIKPRRSAHVDSVVQLLVEEAIATDDDERQKWDERVHRQVRWRKEVIHLQVDYA